MNRHIITATTIISLFAFLACNLICDVDELNGASQSDGYSDSYSDSDSDSDSDTDTGTGSDPLYCEGGRYDESTGLCWQAPNLTSLSTWQEAIDYCDDLDLAGHTDWYLPSRDDFIDLLGDCDSAVTSGNSGYCNSCDESETCSALFGSDIFHYWSSSPYESDQAWYAYFSEGRVHYYFASHFGYHIRCVRTGP